MRALMLRWMLGLLGWTDEAVTGVVLVAAYFWNRQSEFLKQK